MGRLDHLPRTFSAFNLPAGFERVKFALEVRGRANGVVSLTSDATGPWREREPLYQSGRRVLQVVNGDDAIKPGPWSHATLDLCGDIEAGAMFASFFRGECALGWVADWIEDDIDDRVKFVAPHWNEAHRLHPDPVYHFLTLMRCYRDGRKRKAK